jgi:hypothetical protein
VYEPKVRTNILEGILVNKVQKVEYYPVRIPHFSFDIIQFVIVCSDIKAATHHKIFVLHLKMVFIYIPISLAKISVLFSRFNLVLIPF